MFGIRGRRIALAVLGWLAAATGAVAVGLIAVSFLSRSLTGDGQQPLSGSEVVRALERGTQAPRTGPPTDTSTPNPTPTPTPTTTSDPTDTPGNDRPVTSAPRGLTSVGGTVIARCVDGKPRLQNWSPKPGYEVDDDSGNRHTVKFEPDDDDANPTVRLRVRCEGNRPVGDRDVEYDD